MIAGERREVAQTRVHIMIRKIEETKMLKSIALPDESPPVTDCLEILENVRKELASFYQAVLALHGKDQARTAALDWIDVIETMALPTDETILYGRRVTILASARLASRICY